MPESIPLYHDATDLPCKGAAAVVGARFVAVNADRTTDGNISVGLCGAAARALGVSQFDAPLSEDYHVTVSAGPGLVVPVTCAAAIVAGAEVQSDATGQAVTFTTGIKNGQAVSTTTAAGQLVFVKLY